MNLQYDVFLKRYESTPNAILLDVRTQQEYDSKHLATATNIDIKSKDFLEEIAELSQQKSYFVYCSKGIRSQNTCIVMVQMGFKNVYNLKGGLTAKKDTTLV